MKEVIIAGLDVGSENIKIAVGSLSKEGKVNVIGGAEYPSQGINKGAVISVEDAVESISKCLEKAERMIGLPIESAWVGVSGLHITTQETKGVVAIAKADGEIKESDLDRALDAAQAVATPINYEILHVLSKSFAVDNQVGIKDPVGMTGVRLEVEAQIIEGLSTQIKNLRKCVSRTGLDIDTLVFSVLATAEAVSTKRQQELGVAVVNIGATTTSLVVYEEGNVLLTKVLPIGSAHITNDVAIGLRTSLDLAEKIKISCGSALAKEINKKEEIDLSKLDENEQDTISKKQVIEIIEARVEEIFQMIDKELIKIDRSGKLPAGVILTGGGARLNNIIEAAKKELRLPAFLGYAEKAVMVIDKLNDPIFSTAIGLVLWGSHYHSGYGNIFPARKLWTRFKKWVKSLLP